MLRGVPILNQQLERSIFEAGCDDAIRGIRNGVAFLEFDRQAATLPAAVLDAIQEVETVDGVDVVRVEPDDLVSASEIARRAGRSRESIRQLAGGMRGPGGFPAPVYGLRSPSPLWRWAEVADWMSSNVAGDTVAPADVEAAAFLAVLNSALHIHHLVPTLSTVNALWSAIGQWRTRRPPPRFGWIRLVREAAGRS